MLLNKLTNALFFATISSGAAMLFFDRQTFEILYLGFGTSLVLSELYHTTVRTVFLYFIITLALTILAIKSALGSAIPLSFIPNLVIGAALAHSLNRGEIRPIVAYLFFYLITGYLTYHMLIGTDPNVLLMASQNGISSYAISSLMILIFFYRQRMIEPPLFPAAVCLVLCIWAIGRSGITASVLIFAAVLFARSRRLKLTRLVPKKRWGRVFIFVLSVFMIFIICDKFIIDENSYLYYFIAKGFRDDERKEMIMEYLNNMTSIGVAIGLDLGKLPIISSQSSNPHNSYIVLHASIGFVGIIMLSFISFHVISEIIIGNVGYGIAVLAYLFRIATDSEIGMNVFTFIFLTLTLKGISSFISKKNVKIGEGLKSFLIKRNESPRINHRV